MSSSTTTTFSNVVATTTTLSLPAMPPCQLQQPELSIEAQCQSLDVLGVYKCWSLKDNSPAHLVWNKVSKAVITLLEDKIEHLDARDSDLMVEMFMIGRKAKTPRPTVLFSCESKPCRRKAMELVQKKSILACYPGVLMAECSRLPKLLALGDGLEMRILPPGVYLNGPLRSCGTNVLISGNHDKSCRNATVGGIVCVDDNYYGLTCAHAFSETKEKDTSEDPDLEFAFYEPDNPISSFDDEDYYTEITSQGSISSSSSRSQTTDELGSNENGPVLFRVAKVFWDMVVADFHHSQGFSDVWAGLRRKHTNQRFQLFCLDNIKMSEKLKGKVAIVTGGASGFGLGIAAKFVEEGAKVVIADLSEDSGQKAAHELGCEFVTTDVTKREAWQALLQKTIDAYGGPDIVINNAGATYSNKPTAEVTDEDFDLCINVNLRSVYLCSSIIVPYLLEKKKPGCFIQVSSTAALRPRPHLTWYNASKAAVSNATKTLAVEYAPHKIRFNAVCPVVGITGMTHLFIGKENNETNRAAFVSTIPLGRACLPKDVANACSFLASDEAEFITGVNLEVDGGRCV